MSNIGRVLKETGTAYPSQVPGFARIFLWNLLCVVLCVFALFVFVLWLVYPRRVWRYQRDNKNPYIEEEQKTQWQTEKVQKDKQRSTKHTHCRSHWIAPFVFSNVYLSTILTYTQCNIEFISQKYCLSFQVILQVW
jgi:energy-coupling factor transporter transmembrane protein EcfT